MPPYVLLIDWTKQGVENLTDSTDRYEGVRRRDRWRDLLGLARFARVP